MQSASAAARSHGKKLAEDSGGTKHAPTDSTPVTRLLYLRDTLQICGPGKTILNTWRTLDRERFHLTVAATRPQAGQRNALLDALSALGASTVELSIGRGLDVVALKRLVGLIRSLKIDILQTHDAQTRRLGVLAAVLTGVHHVTSVHGWIFNDGKQRAARWLDARLIRSADSVVAVSDRLRQDLEAAGVSPARITMLRNAVLLQDYPATGLDLSLKAGLGIPSAHRVVSIIGRLSLEKGHEPFLRAAKLVLQQDPNVTFLIVGDGPLRSRLVQLVEEMGLGPNVIFTGHRSNMAAVYAITDLLVISSFTEGIPNALLEAFAFGKPAVATDVGGVGEVLQHGKTGRLIRPGDPDAIAHHVLDLFKDAPLLSGMGSAARKSIEEHFRFELRTQAVERLYAGLSRHESGPQWSPSS